MCFIHGQNFTSTILAHRTHSYFKVGSFKPLQGYAIECLKHLLEFVYGAKEDSS
jgi:hypothetical protein